ncbi:MAG: hypothetical protein L6R48_24795 [Planctomycetes bacterium]|nr:hypothetical protein [Planctomycetota bacterium]
MQAKRRVIRKPRSAALDGFATGLGNRPVGVAQHAVMEAVWRWLGPRYDSNTALAAHLAPFLGKVRLDRTFLSHVRHGKAALPPDQIPAWVDAFAGDAVAKRTALRQLLAIATTHEAVLDLFDWQAEVQRLALILRDGKRYWPMIGCYER